jgi:ribokinase
MTDRRAGVVVVGSINVDYVVAVAQLPRSGETVTGGTFARHFGGKGANQAVAASRYGAPVTFVGAVGDDDAGRESVQDLRAEGIDVSHAQVLGNHATGAAVITVAADGLNQIAVASGANHAIGSAFREVLTDAAPGVLLTVFELGEHVVVGAADLAANAGWTVIVNPAPARRLPKELLDSRPILTPNEAEATALTGQFEPHAAAQELARLTDAPVIVTLGAAGAVYCDHEGTDLLPAMSVCAVDSTGAGDTFNGVLAAAIFAGSTPREAARQAVAAASYSTEHLGARGGMLSRIEIDRRLASANDTLPGSPAATGVRDGS